MRFVAVVINIITDLVGESCHQIDEMFCTIETFRRCFWMVKYATHARLFNWLTCTTSHPRDKSRDALCLVDICRVAYHVWHYNTPINAQRDVTAISYFGGINCTVYIICLLLYICRGSWCLYFLCIQFHVNIHFLNSDLDPTFST